MTIPQNPNLIYSIVTIAFYLILFAFIIYSLLATYALLRYGRSKKIGLITAAVYIVICTGLFTFAIINLNNLKV
jgi:hypothetical protein